MPPPRLEPKYGIIEKIGKGDDGPVGHFPCKVEVFLLKQDRKVTKILDEYIVYNRELIIINKAAIKGIRIKEY